MRPDITSVDDLTSRHEWRRSMAAIMEGPTKQALSYLTPADKGFDDARLVWNAMIDRRPALIALCTSVEDVVAAVGGARKLGLPIAVRGGGHNVAGFALCDG